MENKAGVRDLKNRLSSYLKRVMNGETILITDRGKAVARLVPVGTSPAERLSALQQAGLVAGTGGRLDPVRPVAPRRGARDVAALLVEDRE